MRGHAPRHEYRITPNFEDSMASQELRREQITIPIDTVLRQRLELAASREHRTIASYVRHVVAQALEQQQAAA